MLTLPVGGETFLTFLKSCCALIVNVLLKIRQVHSLNSIGSRNIARAQTLKMAKSNAGLVPTNKVLVAVSFVALSHLKFKPFIKVGYKIRGRKHAVNGVFVSCPF